ncbi:MAG: DNA-protecting protein DprA, partial [Deltaproteobacteria bacterium]|nr:DNA-protecting protein DprA [Deltaproteobacteria bacterium]
MRNDDSYHILKLLNVPGLGNVKVKKILDHCTYNRLTIKEFVGSLVRGEKNTRLLTDSQIANLRDDNLMPEDQWMTLQKQNVRILTIGDDDYPDRVASALNNRAPALLFAKGDLSLLKKPSLGFCGARKASEKGLKTAWDCADQMARMGANIISGYASGVDMTCHKAALEAGGSTTIVLAEGILNFGVKKDLRNIFDESRVLVLSEFLPGVPWSVRNAMQRNFTICALSHVMILIEAQKRGGSINAG